MRPVLSIVIANYNYGRFLEQAIRSVLSQISSEVELIICDGGSKDDSVGIIKKYADAISWWCSEPDGGQSSAFNKGFSHARGKYLTWLNADDILAPGAVRAIVREVRRHPDCEWFTGNFFRFAETDKRIIGIGWGPHWYPKWLQRKHSPLVVFGPSTIFAKALWERAGKIDENLHFMMDMEMWMRFVMMGVKQRRIRHFVWGFRMHEESKTAEFGEHKMPPEQAKKFDAESRRTFAKTGYSESRLLRFVSLAFRFLDGSLARLLYYRHFLTNLNDMIPSVSLVACSDAGYFRFQSWFCQTAQKAGLPTVADSRLSHGLRATMGRLFGSLALFRHGKMIVCGCHRIESCAWPWNWRYEIVPMMWDLWPDNYAAFRRFVRRNGVKTVLCTASDSVAWINENCCDVRAHWIPEAVDVSAFPMGPDLGRREIDVLTYGRAYEAVYQPVATFLKANCFRYQHGAGATFEEMTAAVRDAKVTLCYPLSVTNPAKAQGVETLTQRYWEAMLSGTLMVGHAPRELIEVCGYNPVIEAGDDSVGTVRKVLANLTDYQELANRNRQMAEKVGSWSARMDRVMLLIGKGVC